MELLLRTDNETSIAKIIALAEKLNVSIERLNSSESHTQEKEILKQRILNFNATTPSSFGDAAEWQNKERLDRELPFSS